MDCKELLALPPFGVEKQEKEEILLQLMIRQQKFHQENCLEYQRFLQTFQYHEKQVEKLEELPFLPASVFKELRLKSIREEDIFKELTSSGTTGQAVSHIYLDRDTAASQQRALCRIMESFLGENRLPFLVVDSPDLLVDRSLFSARGAAVLGFSIFASSMTYALDKNLEPAWEVMDEFLDKQKQGVVFGFTYLLWMLTEKMLQKGIRVKLPQGSILLHGGGWKKLQNLGITGEVFKKRMKEVLGVEKVINYYGMAEQTGCIYLECEEGHLHASTYSDILIRDEKSFHILGEGKEGLIQVLTPIAASYPGHSVLTQDLGVLLGEDNCPCGRKGKYFHMTGRMKHAEVRGCSDTHDA